MRSGQLSCVHLGQESLNQMTWNAMLIALSFILCGVAAQTPILCLLAISGENN